MERPVALCALLVLYGTASIAAEASRKPWEWTVDERIAERCDRKAARARVESARAQRLAPVAERDGKRTWLDVSDMIRGRHAPHLLLPTEVFESVVRNGFLVEGWREAFADQAIESGLPETFWKELEEVSAPYVDDLREQRQLAQMTDRAAVHGQQQALDLRLCGNRADALAKARALFGTALDIFMYQHVAQNITIHVDHVETPTRLKSREEGCR